VTSSPREVVGYVAAGRLIASVANLDGTVSKIGGWVAILGGLAVGTR
jgi:hypothetical protein